MSNGIEAKFAPDGGVITREIQVEATTCSDCITDNLHMAGTEAEVCVNMLCPTNVELLRDPA